MGACTGLYKPVQALKVESLQEKQAMSDLMTETMSLWTISIVSKDK